jgi:AraC-like DNA-binding protein
MVRNRHVVPERIPDVAFAAPVGTPAGVEVLSLAELRSRPHPVAMTAPTRPAFHHLLTLSSGVLKHTVDFTGYTLEPGPWLWVRPGQVEQWHDFSQAEGTLILFEPDFLDPATAESAALRDPYAPALRTGAGEELAALRLAAGHLQREFNQAQGLPPDVHVAVLRHLLAALLLRLAHLPGPAGTRAGEPPGIFLRFRDAVESDFTSVRRVEDYARVLGYSPRTLSRATIASAGTGPKDFIDRRVILEARRLLAHSDRSAAQIAAQLGFSSATNFSKFFRQRTGASPIAFRADVRGEHSPGPR